MPSSLPGSAITSAAAPEDHHSPASRIRGILTTLAVLVFVVMVWLRTDYPAADFHEQGDFAANSLAVLDARDLSLLHGNYSRKEFYHPGPAFLYIQAMGECLFYDWLGLSASPFGGQTLATIVLHTALVLWAASILASTTGIRSLFWIYSIVLLTFSLVHGWFGLCWPPHHYFFTYQLLLISCAAWASGNLRAMTAAAVSGALLIHGHVSFVLIVPLVMAPAVLISLPQVRNSSQRKQIFRQYLCAIAISAPLIAVVIWHFVAYPETSFLAYAEVSAADKTGGNSPAASVGFVASALGFTQPGGYLLLAALFVLLLAMASASREPKLRRFFFSQMVILAASFVAVFCYVARGADNTWHPSYLYILLFQNAVVPIGFVLLLTSSMERLPARAATSLVAALALLLGWQTLRTPIGIPGGLPPAIVEQLEALHESRPQNPILGGLDGNAVVGAILHARRSGHSLQTSEYHLRFMTTRTLYSRPILGAGRSQTPFFLAQMLGASKPWTLAPSGATAPYTWAAGQPIDPTLAIPFVSGWNLWTGGGPEPPALIVRDVAHLLFTSPKPQTIADSATNPRLNLSFRRGPQPARWHAVHLEVVASCDSGVETSELLTLAPETQVLKFTVEPPADHGRLLVTASILGFEDDAGESLPIHVSDVWGAVELYQIRWEQ